MLKLTKIVHSCVLVEDDEHTAIFDPGEFAWELNPLSKLDLEKLDYVLITHEHPDHFSLDFVKALVDKFPELKIITTESIVEKLKDVGIKATEEPDDNVQVTYHEHTSMKPLVEHTPQHIRFDYKDVITHPGDSIDIKSSKDVLLLPLAGPWEAPIEAVRLADRIRPKVVIPVHDKMWSDEWRSFEHERMEKYFASQNINFVALDNGESVRLF
jgi:L-ascorbate metabolism protein UlaG (beta-lactamase superfamily)